MKRYGLLIAWLITCAATIGCICLGEGLFGPPCAICWLQRAFMFPLTILLGIAFFRKSYAIIPYCLPLALLGLLFALFHFLTLFVDFLSTYGCNNPICVAKKGKLLMPILSFISFFLLNFVLIWTMLSNRKRPSR